jgi:hypothetical protein
MEQFYDEARLVEMVDQDDEEYSKMREKLDGEFLKVMFLTFSQLGEVDFVVMGRKM